METGRRLADQAESGGPVERSSMQDHTPKNTPEERPVNTDIPGPAEPRWVVAVLDFGEPRYQRYGREPELVRILDPKTGEAASRFAPETWADHDRAKNACGTKRFKDDGHELGTDKNRPVFVDKESRLRHPDGRLVFESAEVA